MFDLDRGQTLALWGWDDLWAAALDAQGLENQEPARVVGQNRDLWDIQTSHGPEKARLVSAKFVPLRPVVGDWITAQPGINESDPWSIGTVLPRRTRISRGTAGTGKLEQILAANVDKIWIVQGLDTELNLRRLERYLAVAWDSGATPEIILTKTDLLDDLDPIRSELEDISIAVTLRFVNRSDRDSIEALKQSLRPGSTVCLLGPSGVGKSTLVNALAQEEIAKTGEVRAGDNKGRHTTSHRELFTLPGGICLLDTPGMRELRIWDMDEGISNAFPDIDELAVQCRFRNCGHDTEPGCAVVAAVEAKALDAGRLQSYRKLQAEVAHEKRKSDPRARASAVSDYKAIMKSFKQHPKYKNRS